MTNKQPLANFDTMLGKLGTSIAKLLQTSRDDVLPVGPHELEAMASRVASARGGYPCILEERTSYNINRMGSVLLGPVFTSERHPWPTDAHGTPMVPLCQLNTAQFPRPVNDDVRGLIQVWLTPTEANDDEAYIRVVPEAEVDAAALSPVITTDEDLDVLLPEAADWLRCFHAGPRPSKAEVMSAAASRLGFANADELADANWDEWEKAADGYDEKYEVDLVFCWQLTGYETERLYCYITHDERSRAAELKQLAVTLRKKGLQADKPVVAQLDEFCTSFEAVMEACSESNFPCLFGTFHEIQYPASARGTPVLCLESLGLRDWGEGGNAQVFFDEEKGLYFDWSCS